MSNINKQAREKLKAAAAKANDNFDPNMFVMTRDVLALLDELEAKDRRNAELNSTLERWATDRAQSASELEAAEKRIAELEEALKQSVSGYKSCLRTGHERIIELGGDCDAPEMMIARNPDIQQAEKVLAAGIITKVGE
jgi:DNA repair exonuclease SbcCD ATPase subunit